MGRLLFFISIIVFCLLNTEGAEEKGSVKRGIRAPALTNIRQTGEEGLVNTRWESSRSSSIIKNNNKHNDDEEIKETQPPPPPPPVPAGFLSPSVLEYLELGKAIPGRPGTDYPILAKVPYTNFYCEDQLYPGFFADVDTRCQVWHYCDIDGRQASFLCPNGTQFNQAVFVCDWWFNVRCDLSPALYIINDRLYRRPKHDIAKPHRTITKELLENIFV